MKKTISIVIIIVFLAVGAIVVGSNSSDKSSKKTDNQSVATASDPNSINIQDFSFKADSLTIKKGTTITWTNQDDAHHDITPTSGAKDFVTSKLLSKGESYKFTFDKAGTYKYKCSPHPYMTGTIEVTE